jgi:hypothetical protein
VAEQVEGNQSVIWVAEQRDNGITGRWVAAVNWGMGGNAGIWMSKRGDGWLNRELGG